MWGSTFDDFEGEDEESEDETTPPIHHDANETPKKRLPFSQQNRESVKSPSHAQFHGSSNQPRIHVVNDNDYLAN